jgi:hypothetical protein
MRSSTKKGHFSRWTAIRVVKLGVTFCVYPLDQSGRLQPSKIPRNPRRVLTQKRKIQHSVQFSVDTQEKKEEDLFAMSDLEVRKSDEYLEFEESFVNGFVQFPGIDDSDFFGW